MTVSELIEFLQQQPPELKVAYKKFSEQKILDAEEIEVTELGIARPDGWIHDKRPDKEAEKYLVFPGN